MSTIFSNFFKFFSTFFFALFYGKNGTKYCVFCFKMPQYIEYPSDAAQLFATPAFLCYNKRNQKSFREVNRMYKIMRMIFALIAAVLVAMCVPAGIFWDMIAVWCCAGGALLFFVLSMLFKYFQEEREKKDEPSAAPPGEDKTSETSDKKDDQ